MDKTFLVVTVWFVFSFSNTFSQGILVSSRNSNSVKQYDLDGNFIRNFVTANSGGLSLPQELVWHPDGFLLVTGRGNFAIKKYDGATGAYLGNFTSGYSLDNPTKTSIWQDSLLYVSQWGATQNKVARFDLKTGVFVDEFTHVGVPNACGHAWDTEGNLLVAQYGSGINGKVLKFDPNGTLIGDFIPSTLLQGPVNLWFDKTGSLFVADWTLGNVLKFNGATGGFQSTAISGLTNLEGFAFDSQGRLYLCDWTDNQVFRFDFATNTLSPFITTGSLAAPNSILVREMLSPASEISIPGVEFTISPNPVNAVADICYFLQKPAQVNVEVLHVSGQNVATLFSGKQMPGEQRISWNGLTVNGLRAQARLYFVRLTVGNEAAVKPLVWK